MRILIFRRGRSGSVAMVKAIDIGDGNPENKLPGPPGWGLGVRPVTSPQKTFQTTKPQGNRNGLSLRGTGSH